MKTRWLLGVAAWVAFMALGSGANAALVGYWNFDHSGNVGLCAVTGAALTAAGDAQYTAAGRTGGGLLLDGNGDYLGHNPTGSVPSGIPIGNSSYTVSAWIRPTATGARGIVGWGNFGSSRQVNALRLNGMNGFSHYWWGADLVVGVPAPTNLSDGNWHHVVATYNGKMRSLWLNGQMIGQDTPGANNAQPANFRIGSTNNGEFFQGTLDDVAIYGRGMTDNQIQALAAGAAPTSMPLPTPVDHFTADALAALGNGHVLANGDWTSSTGGASANVAGGNATLRTNAIGDRAVVNFDGDDFLRIVNGAMTTTAGGDFSVAAVYRTNGGVGGSGQWYQNTSIVDSEQAGGTNDWGLNIASDGRLAAGLGGPDVSQYSTSDGHHRDGLAHIAVYTRQGSTVSLYVDGVLAGTRSDGGTAVRNAVDYFFGGNHTGGNRLNGDIAEVRVYNVPLTATEVGALSATLLDTYAGSPYQQAVLASAPRHYYRLGEGTTSAAQAYSEVSLNHGTYYNSPTVNQPGALLGDGNTAVYFDGVNDYVRVANDLPASFSLEALIRTTATSLTGPQAYHGNGILWSDVAGVTNDFVFAMLNDRLAFFDGHANATIQGSTPVNDGAWHHVVVTREAGGLMQIYLNGQLEASGAAGSNPLTANPFIDIGGNTLDNRFFNGWIDEVALYDRALTSGEIWQHYAAVPEPGTFLLGCFALLGMLALRRRNRNGNSLSFGGSPMFRASSFALFLGLALGVLGVCPADGATVIGYWKFDEFNTTPGNHNAPADNFQVVDSSGNLNPLYSYSGSGYNYTASTNLPGGALFAGSNSYSVVPDLGGLMFHEVNHSGNAFNLAGTSFTLEGYFKTDGNKAGAGRMDVIYNSQNTFSYLVNLNEQVGGQLRFAVGGSPHPQINLGGGAGRNYANGEWHYFIARYDERGAGSQDVLTFTTYDQDGRWLETAHALTPAGFTIAPTSSNLSVGSQIHAARFQGNLDEVRISRGLVDRKWQLNHLREVVVDTFDNTHNYKAAGVAGTVWDGLLNPGGASVIATTNSPTLPGDGNLEIAIPNNSAVGFDAAYNNAPFLFRNVRGGLDFDAQLVLESTTAGNYSAAGLMVRLADPLADGIAGVANQEDFLSLVYQNFGTVRNTVRNLNDGSQTDTNYNAGAIERFLRITREDDLFSLYTRPDKFSDWRLLHTQQRSDLAGDVQVGLWHGYFGGGTAGSAQFENFLLMVVPEPSSLVLLGLGIAALLGARPARRRRSLHGGV